MEKVTVTWPDGKTQVLNDVAANQLVTVDYQNAESLSAKENEPNDQLFTEKGTDEGIDFIHKENFFIDFRYKPLLPHKTSNFGPNLAVGDANGDGLEDFYIGGAAESAGALWVQQTDGNFVQSQEEVWLLDSVHEDLGTVFFDADSDGDLDLYVVSGGNEFEKNAPELQDRISINQGGGSFVKSPESLPEMLTSGGRVVPGDFDQDGDIDLFVGGRLVPRTYPMPARSFLLRNQGGRDLSVRFEDVTPEIAPDLMNPGMVTDATWTDYDNDNDLDLMVVGDWMPISFFENQRNSFSNVTEDLGFANSSGWWFKILAQDFDGDGDSDFVIGNLGLNYKYQATENESFDVFAYDFDASGRLDIVLGYYDQGIQFPVRGRECSSEQIPQIGYVFNDYNSFADATLEDIYTEQGLEASLHYQARNFASSYVENLGGGEFKIRALPNQAQVSSVNGILSGDYNSDGNLDLLLVGNLFVSEVETTRNDASIGLFMAGDGTGNFKPVPLNQSGFLANLDAKDLVEIRTPQGKLILVANNDDRLQVFRVNDQLKKLQAKVR